MTTIAAILGTAPNVWLTTFLPVAAVFVLLLIAFAMMWQVRNRIANRDADLGSPRERIDRVKARVETEDELDRRNVELLETARRLSAQLDTKSRQLELLIDQADQRIAVIHGGAVLRDRPGDAAEGSTPGAEVESETLDPLTARVHQLADEGRSPVEIAAELEEATGKVELILALRRSS